MKSFSRLFLALGAFLTISLVVYGWHAREYEGVLLSITVAIAAVMFGGYGAVVVRRSRLSLTRPATDAAPAPAGEPTHDHPADAAVELDEPHVGPTIWPLVYAISAIALVIGAVGNRWMLVPGAALFLAASIGWVRDVHQQWHHHVAAAHGGYGEHASPPDDAEPAAMAAVPRQSAASPDGSAPASTSDDEQVG